MLEDLSKKLLVWKSHSSIDVSQFRETSYKPLNEILPGGGWPEHGMTEILSERVGMGALRLLLPVIARVTGGQKKVICIDPPYIPYYSGLFSEGLDLSNFIVINPPLQITSRDREILKIYEDSLKVEDCSIALIWLSKISFKDSRRLQLAALACKTWGVIFLPADVASVSSSSPLRVGLESVSLASGFRNLKVRILKARGRSEGRSVLLKL